MKKKVISLCIILSLMISGVAYAAGEDTPYNVVVPLEYDFISSISGDLFVTRNSGTFSNDALYSLYRFDGTQLLSGMQEISFAGEYLFVKKDDDMGVYSRDLKVIVPVIYKDIFMKDATHCIAIDGKEYLRPGSWWGDMYLYDLTTGQITDKLGYGDGLQYVDYEASQKQLSEQWNLDASGPGCVSISMNGDGWAPISYCKAYNSDGQLLLDFKPYCATWEAAYNELYYGCSGLFLYGINGSSTLPDSMNYIFSGRGRLIAKQPYASFSGIIGGKYICAFGSDLDNTKSYIMDRDGNTVIPQGTFDTYAFNNTTSGQRSIISDVDGDIVVSKGGKYGIITLPDIELQPSDWAKAEVARAVDKNLVPEDIRLWWKDSCTREEFCRMLSLSVKEITGKTLAELSVGSDALTFSDCDNPDVLAASALGIVNGIGNDRFAPNRFITREQAAVMLARAGTLLNIPLSGDNVSFADDDQISDWARIGIDTVSQVLCGDAKTPLMQGVCGNRFSPQGYYTVEQSAITILRLTESVR